MREWGKGIEVGGKRIEEWRGQIGQCAMPSRGLKKGEVRWGGGRGRYLKGAEGEGYGNNSRLEIMGAGEEGGQVGEERMLRYYRRRGGKMKGEGGEGGEWGRGRDRRVGGWKRREMREGEGWAVGGGRKRKGGKDQGEGKRNQIRRGREGGRRGK